MQIRVYQASDGGDWNQHELSHHRRCHAPSKSDDRGLDPVGRFYFQLTTIHSLAAQRPAEFPNTFFQNVLQHRSPRSGPLATFFYQKPYARQNIRTMFLSYEIYGGGLGVVSGLVGLSY